MTPEQARALRIKQIEEIRSIVDSDLGAAASAREGGAASAATGFELAAMAGKESIAELESMNDDALVKHYTYCLQYQERVAQGY